MSSTSPISYLRPAIALMIPIGLFGVVFGYSSFVASLPVITHPDFTQLQAEGKYQIELTLTFTAQPDWGDYENRSFYLMTSGHASLASGDASSDGDRTIVSSKKSIPPGEPLLFDVAGKVVQGTNQFDLFVGVPDDSLASPGGDDFGEAGFDLYETEPGAGATIQQQRAVRVRVLKDGVALSETTLWSEPGQPIRDSFTLVIPSEETTIDEK